MRKTTWLPILVTVAALAGVFLLAVSYFALNSARLSTIIFGEDTGLGPQKSTSFVVDDPLITYVPAGERSENQKTKVFVSSQDPIIGNTTAKVYVILYGSLLDYDMGVYLDAMQSVQAEYGDDVAVIWKDYTATDVDDQAAIVGHCANDVAKFWDYAAAVDSQSDFAGVAETVGANRVEVEDCVDTGGKSAVVGQSAALGKALGVTTTHSLFVNDELYVDPISLNDLKARIDATLASFE